MFLAADPFVVRIVDSQTKRGVPLVELKTTDHRAFYTDNSGLVAIDNAPLLGEEVFFFGSSHGYELPKDGFGYRGKRLHVEAGKTAEIAINRTNIADACIASPAPDCTSMPSAQVETCQSKSPV